MTRATTARIVLATCVVALVIAVPVCGPTGAATTTPATPTTVSAKQLAKQTTKTLKPLAIAIAVVLVLSFIVGESGRTKRRRKRAREPRPRRAPVPKSSKATTIKQQRPRPSPPPAESGARIWGRPAGGSAVARAAELKRESEQWSAGAIGEQKVGLELERLPAGAWWVFHDIPRGANGTNVDHLVIGVGGVFTVNSKNVSGNVWVAERTLMVNGVSENYFPVAVSEAKDVSRRVSSANSFAVVARPLLVFLELPTIKAMPADVTVLHLGNVVDWISRQPPIYTAEQAYAIVGAADRLATWA